MKSILNLLSIREYIMGGISLLFAGVVHGQNPIVQTCYTTDPAPMVHDGTLYVYTGHDEDKADFLLDAGMEGLFYERYGELDRSWLSTCY